MLASTRLLCPLSLFLSTSWLRYKRNKLETTTNNSGEDDGLQVLYVFQAFAKHADFSSVTQSCPILCDLMDCSTPGFPVYHQLLELAQTHVHWVGDAIQPSHPLSSPSPPAFNLSQHHSLFQWVSSSHQVAKVLELLFSISPSNEYSGLISFRMDFFESPCSPRDSQESSPTPHFKSINSLALSFPYSPALTSIHDYWKNHSFD